MKIPLHSLVIIIGHNSRDKRQFIKNTFQEYEVVSKEKICNLYFGENINYKSDFILSEYLNLINSKLLFGERVVLTDHFFSNNEREFLIDLAKKYSVPLYYILVDEIYDKNIIEGDNVALVCKYSDNIVVVTKFKSPINIFELKTKGFSGITVVPDIHGSVTALQSSISWAIARNNLLIFLGDIIDYGNKSLECVEIVYELVKNGKALMVKGNHERKLEKWLIQEEKIKNDPSYSEKNQSVILTNSNKITIEQIESLNKEQRFKFENRFTSLMSWAANHWIIEDILFTHGACDPEMFSIYNKSLHGRYEKLSLYGEVDYDNPQKENGYPNRIYDWVNRIPTNKIVFVGHDIRSFTKPYHEENDYGGQVYFMDTGCSKNGHLTTADIIIDNNKLLVTNFNKLT